VTRLARAATALVVVGVVLSGIGVWKLAGTGTSSGAATTVTTTPPSLLAALEAATKARAPFAGLTATRIRIGGRSVRVVIADSANERTEGLRERRDLGSYRGMLFDFRTDTTTSFTMSTVPVALDIGFYDAAGRVVDRLRMEPCAGSETECPVYSAKGPFRYAVETLAGRLLRGRLS
jgi:uncharacterized membrane protein (UPF0127 family)